MVSFPRNMIFQNSTLLYLATLFSSMKHNYSVHFVKRQANEVAHILVRKARFKTCTIISNLILTYITSLMSHI